MSYILAALKKADQEHFLGSVPDLATPHEVKPAPSRSHRWLWVIVTLLSVNVVLVAMLLKYKTAEVTEAPAAAPMQLPLEQQQTPLKNDQVAQPVQPATEAQDGAAQPAVTAAPSQATLASTPATTTPPAVTTLPPKNEPVLSRGEVVVLPEPAYLQGSETLVTPEETLTRQLGGMVTTNDNAQVQSWFELPQEFRNKIDLPRLDVHVYSEAPQGRFILVNLKKYREGDTLPNGLFLEEILPDGMVMSYQDERFLVKK